VVLCRTENPMPNLRRNHHYIPECYQRGFADATGRVWVKLASKSKLEHRQPRTVGSLRSFYIRKQNGVETDNVERFFEKIDTPFALISQRVRNEGSELGKLSRQEVSVIRSFVASQAVRTIAHKRCVEEQAGCKVDSGLFVSVMLRMLKMLFEAWRSKPPGLDFCTPLPLVGEQFITGDSPVAIVRMIDNPVVTLTAMETLQITRLEELLRAPGYSFRIALSPYVMVSVHDKNGAHLGLPPRRIEPSEVRLFNKLIRDQSKVFTLARDADKLA